MKTSSGRDEKPVTEPTECRSCHAEILWVTWPKTGKKMSVDFPSDNRPWPKGGNIVLSLREGPFGVLVAEFFDPAKHGANRNRYTSHFATCPEADKWRRDV